MPVTEHTDEVFDHTKVSLLTTRKNPRCLNVETSTSCALMVMSVVYHVVEQLPSFAGLASG